MGPSDPPGCFSSMPKGPLLWSPHKTDILVGEPGTRASHLRSAAGTAKNRPVSAIRPHTDLTLPTMRRNYPSVFVISYYLFPYSTCIYTYHINLCCIYTYNSDESRIGVYITISQ